MQKGSLLLNEVLKDVSIISKTHGLDETLIAEFDESIPFFPTRAAFL